MTSATSDAQRQKILELIQERPRTAREICTATGIHQEGVAGALYQLRIRGRIRRIRQPTVRAPPIWRAR